MTTGGGWFGWVVAVTDLALAERRLGREPMRGNRRRPDGVELRWRQIGVNGLGVDPQIPFLVQWEDDGDLHPSAQANSEVRMVTVRLAGEPPARRRRDRVGGAARHAGPAGRQVRHPARAGPALSWPVPRRPVPRRPVPRRPAG